jgi:hypothetical protein
MSDICLPIDANAGAPSFPAAQHRVALSALQNGRADRPLSANSGIKPNADPTVTVTATQWTVTPFAAVVDPLTGAATGPFLCAFTANKTGSINAADATNPRIDRLDLQVPDDPAGASPLAPVIVYTVGQPNATPSAPAAPVRSTPLGTISVPKAGSGSPSFTATWNYCAAAGAITLARNSAGYPASPYVGQYVHDKATDQLLRWTGTAWAMTRGTIFVASDSSAYPASPYTGQTVYDIALATLVCWNGTAWRRPKGIAYEGSFAGTSDASGYLIVTHGLPFTPSRVDVMAPAVYGGTTLIAGGADQVGATTFRIRFFTLATASGSNFYVAIRTSAAVGGDWVAYE